MKVLKVVGYAIALPFLVLLFLLVIWFEMAFTFMVTTLDWQAYWYFPLCALLAHGAMCGGLYRQGRDLASSVAAVSCLLAVGLGVALGLSTMLPVWQVVGIMVAYTSSALVSRWIVSQIVLYRKRRSGPTWLDVYGAP